jgi:hypothetical protein
MESNVKEDFNSYKYELNKLKSSLNDDALAEVIKVDNFFDQEDKLFQIFNNGIELSTSKSIENLKSEFNDFISTYDPHDNYKIVLTCNKNINSSFKIYSAESFVKDLPIDINEQLRMWSECLEASNKIITLNGTISLENINPSSIPDKSLPQILASYKVSPEHVNHMVENLNSTLGDYCKILLSKYCLLALSSSNTTNCEDRNSYTFEGYARVVTRTSEDKDYIDAHENIYDVYKLIFIDANFNTRLGLLRNIISVKTSDKLVDIFDADIIKVLHSNYQIYLRDNIKQYIEVKNKTIELMHSLIIKATDRFEEQQKSYQKVAAALSMYIFTVIIGRFIFKSDTNVFSLEITSISTLFIVFSIVYLEFSQKGLVSSENKLIKNLTNLKIRYSNIMHKTELEEIFDQNELQECFDESNNFLSHMIYQVGLIVLITLIWAATGINYFYN